MIELPLHSLSRRSLVGLLASTAYLPTAVRGAVRPLLDVAASSPRFLCNAVTVTRAGTMFLGLPRWIGMDATPSLVRVGPDGALQPFPGGSWNDWRPGGDGAEAFVQVNAVHAFGDDMLWVVDQGAPDRKTVLPGAQKLVRLDPVSGRILTVLRFGDNVLPRGALMNDVRLFGRHLYVTDSGLGAILVHDLSTGRTMRRLSGHPALRQQSGRAVRGTGGLPLEGPDRSRPQVHADMLEVTADGRWLYVSTPTGPVRRMPRALLDDPGVDDRTLAAAIETVASIKTINGTCIDTLGNLYLGEAEGRRITVLAPDGRRATLVRDERLFNPDALFIDARRRLYIPATQSERLSDSNRGRDAVRRPFHVFDLPLPRSVAGIALGDAVSPVPVLF